MTYLQRLVVVLMFASVSLPHCAIAQSSQAVVNAPVEQAKVVEVKDYAEGRVRDWSGRVPIYDGYPVYDITLDIGGKKYVARYESVTGYYPSRWKTGSEVGVKLANGRAYLMNGNEEVPAAIVTGVANDCVQTNFPSTVMAVPSQVPCQ